jgi:low affinity Fe/Cu permease
MFYSVTFLENRIVYEIVWKNVIEQGRPPQMAIWRLCIACWINKTTNTQSQVVLLLIVFPLLQWMDEWAQYYVISTLPVLFSINSVQTIMYLLRTLS